jgi:hypothetical protein
MEDLIPIPEAATDPEALVAIDGNEIEAALRSALGDLIASGELVAYKGRWDDDPEPVERSIAVALLADSRWYRFRIDDPDEERLYFINVHNLVDE